MHNEVSQRSPFEVIIWFTKTDDFEGREFVMKGPDLDKEVRPKNAMICLVDTLTSDVLHGVNELLSDTQIISITGGLGRKPEYSSN
ncbi:MAG: hypothetical protein HN576_13170 [Bacteriovoracaceae bacterium]|nr:hypothetical protein [Bacteriovoracaceae bacterium]